MYKFADATYLKVIRPRTCRDVNVCGARGLFGGGCKRVTAPPAALLTYYYT